MKIGNAIGFADIDGTPNERLMAGVDALPDAEYMVQEKLDGWYGVVIKDAEGIRWQQGWKQYSILQDLLKVLDEFMPNNSVLACEVGHGTESETSWAAEHGYHRIIIFDSPRWQGVDISDKDVITRFEILRDYRATTKYADERFPQIDIVQSTRIRGKADFRFIKSIFRYVVEKGGEGCVIKLASSKYTCGKRNPEQWKMKKYLTKDYIVMGFTESTASTYVKQGMTVAAIKCGLYIGGEVKEVGAVSGFPFDMRKEFSDNPDKYIGRVCEVGGFEIFKSGAMRHPMLLRFRNDRKPEDCTIDN